MAGRIESVDDLNEVIKGKVSAQALRYQVGGDGNLNAEVAIVAEAPGEREVQAGRPLIGGSGSKLWDAMSKRVGLRRNDCYITNVVKRQVSMNKSGDKRDEATPAELAHWEEVVRWELSQLPNLKYVILCGNYALRAFLNETGIMNWRGSVVRNKIGDKSIHFLCTFNPVMTIRDPKLAPVFGMDIHKLWKVMNGKWNPIDVKFHINPSYREAAEWIDKMIGEGKPVGWDIECIGGQTACHGLANSSDEGMCINWRTREDNRYTPEQERMLWLRIQKLLKDPNVKKVTQNGMFDSSWVEFIDRMEVAPIWFDTMLAHHTLYPTLPHNLGFITTTYTDNPYYKDEGKEWAEGGDIDSFWEYNVKDCCYMLKAQRTMQHELESQGLMPFFREHVMRLQPHLVGMTVGGVKVDQQLKAKIADEVAKDVEQILEHFHAKVYEATGESDYKPNPGSPTQMKKLYFEKLHLVGRGKSTGEDNRKLMRKHPMTTDVARDIIDLHEKYAKERKFLGNYANMRIDNDGRIRSEYKQTGVQAAPGRLSSAAPLWGTGTNLQNQPQRAYPMFTADEGYELNYFDLSGAEARVVAYLANIKLWQEDFHRADTLGKDEFDTHRATAAQVFKMKYEDVPAYDREEFPKTTDDPKKDGKITKRFLGKKCKHGLNYRMKPDRLSSTTGIPMNMAVQAYHAYHNAYPEIRKWWKSLEMELFEKDEKGNQKKELWSPFGRRLKMLGRIDNDDALESIVAFKPQSTIGDKVASCIYLIHEDPEFPREHARVILNIHDALIVLNKIGYGEQVRKVMKRHAEAALTINGHEVIIPAEMKVSQPDEHGVHRWSTLKDI